MNRKAPMKRTRRKAPTAAERRHLARVAAMPCMICAMPANVHHVVSDGLKRLSRSHERVVPLCHMCHQDGPEAVHKIGHAAFNEHFCVDLLGDAEALWQDSVALECGHYVAMEAANG